MALTGTLYTFDVALSDVDRGTYEQLAIKAACHPSESPEYLVTRLLAYCLEWREGLRFSKGGVSDPDEPPLLVEDLTGARTHWIEIGAPDAERLHRASKACAHVAVYTHRDPRTLARLWEGARIHRAGSIAVHALDRDLVAALAARLERRMALGVTVTERVLYVTVGDVTLSGPIEAIAIAG